LLPVFASAREKARQASCASNEKQIGTGVFMYTQDYDDQMCPLYSTLAWSGTPCASSYIYRPVNQYWPQLVSPYVQKAIGNLGNGQATLASLSKVFQCPDQVFPTTPQTLGNWSSYGFNDSLVNWYAPNGVCESLQGVKLSVIVAPASSVMLCETRNASIYAPNIFDTKSGHNGVWTYVDSRHNAGAIPAGYPVDPNGLNEVVFNDGHVKAVHWKDLYTDKTLWSISGTGQWP